MNSDTTPAASRVEGTMTTELHCNTTDVATSSDPPKKPRKPVRHYRSYNPRKRLLNLPDGTPISRNSPCFCGSGQRYKRCCKNAHERRQKILQTIDMTGLQPGPHRLEECAVCGAATLRPVVKPADRGITRLHRSCGKCRAVRQHTGIDILLSEEPA